MILARKYINRSGLISLFSLSIFLSCRFYFDTTKDTTVSIPPANVSLENGKNLTYSVCGGCHYNPATGKFIGKKLNDLPKIAGKLYTANLTKSTTHGIPPSYSDAELFYLIKTGIAKNGKFMPYMMRPMMADNDIYDVIEYLRSNDEAVAPADTTIGKSHINFIGKFGIRLATKPAPYIKGVPSPNKNDSIAYGRYLVAIVGCYHCHSAKALKIDFNEPEKSKGYMQGGMKLKDPSGKRIFGPNLTPDNETGIGNYSLGDFSHALKDGITAGGRKLSPPMPKFKHLNDKQIAAIYTYIRSLPPVHKAIKKS